MKKKHNIKSQSGLTLIELSIAILIIGFLSVVGMGYYNVWWHQQKIDITEDRIATVRQAINLYIQQNGVLPCPASLTTPADNSVFGKQSDCSAVKPAGTFEEPGGNGTTVRIGAVPVRTLNIADEYMADSWGRRYIYAVTKEMAQTGSNYRTNRGGIFIIDTNGNPVLDPVDPYIAEPTGAAMYVIASTGPDGFGGYVADSGALYTGCDTSREDGENCDNDATFTSTLLTSTANVAGHYDDELFYEMKDFLKLTAINRYLLDSMPCTQPGAGANMFGENCATASVTGADIFIAPGEEPKDGVLMYTRTLSAETDGRVVVRATIPATYNNQMASPGIWEQAIHAAIYINDTLVSEGMLIDPAQTLGEAEGFAGMTIGTWPSLLEGEVYKIDIYLYAYGNSGVNKRSAWAGTIRHSDISADGMIEILEITDL